MGGWAGWVGWQVLAGAGIQQHRRSRGLPALGSSPKDNGLPITEPENGPSQRMVEIVTTNPVSPSATSLGACRSVYGDSC